MGQIEELVGRYRNHITPPWPKNTAGDQRTLFVVYPCSDERRLSARIELFREATPVQYKWQDFDFTECYANWMLRHNRYFQAYFEEPETIDMKLRSFGSFAAERLQERIAGDEVDDHTIVAVRGVATLFGFARLSSIVSEVANNTPGRLLVFFPGEYENGNYKLLGARDGWNYLAVPITLHNGVGD